MHVSGRTVHEAAKIIASAIPGPGFCCSWAFVGFLFTMIGAWGHKRGHYIFNIIVDVVFAPLSDDSVYVTPRHSLCPLFARMHHSVAQIPVLKSWNGI